jgi:D-3-phosphoglycerate dehydrogenase
MADGAGEPRRFAVRVLNHISASGLARLPAERYRVGDAVEAPDALLLRSADLHRVEIPRSVLAIARAGAGVNNIPVAEMSRRGVPVFNAPGANANAVKELVLAAMLMASRNLPAALRFVDALDVQAPDLEARIEDGKKAFAGFELAGQSLGIVGLGRIGSLVAHAALALGMQVRGHDPEITVDAAWGLPSQVRRAGSVEEVMRSSRFVTLHVPLLPATRHLVGERNLGLLPPGAVLLNFSREGIVDEAAVKAALDDGRLAHYACDFPGPVLHRHPRVTALPHLGASTREAEENCAVMVAEQLRAYLEHGEVTNAVNFPSVSMARESPWRVALANANVPNMLAQISSTLAAHGLNIHNMVNKSRGDVAYTLVDVDSPVTPAVVAALAGIEGVLAVRDLPAETG